MADAWKTWAVTDVGTVRTSNEGLGCLIGNVLEKGSVALGEQAGHVRTRRIGALS